MQGLSKRDLEIIALVELRVPYAEIADRLFLCESTVCNIIKKYRPDLIRKKRTCWSYPIEVKNEARRLFKEGKSHSQISAIMGLTPSTIANWTRNVRGDYAHRNIEPYHKHAEWRAQLKKLEQPKDNPNAWKPSGFIAELPKSKLMAGKA